MSFEQGKQKRGMRGVAGQAMVEFMICVLVIFFFLFFYLSLALLLVTSQYLDYATFMAARTYKASKGNVSDQERDARLVFNAYAQKVQGIARNFRLSFNAISPEDPQSAGVVAEYEMDLFYLPPLFLGAREPVSQITLTSESHLGREPNFEDTLNFFLNFTQSRGIENAEQVAGDMDDTGF